MHTLLRVSLHLCAPRATRNQEVPICNAPPDIRTPLSHVSKNTCGIFHISGLLPSLLRTYVGFGSLNSSSRSKQAWEDPHIRKLTMMPDKTSSAIRFREGFSLKINSFMTDWPPDRLNLTLQFGHNGFSPSMTDWWQTEEMKINSFMFISNLYKASVHVCTDRSLRPQENQNRRCNEAPRKCLGNKQCLLDFIFDEFLGNNYRCRSDSNFFLLFFVLWFFRCFCSFFNAFVFALHSIFWFS